ncbi:hypothetical protein [Roseofilum capinflatum]|uniref:Uncharacterized protein n=1 Tax=Roseofilum capinflatum BLCC-M114 TaxID=3022440 RepID=A0ABT7B777_9CYAN|nr:hypothetical protein [Roseofilum capinflatum]MDJ1175018.1 hypothetical protein [Roseofilum capinflatum BLCC-M114]
MSKERDRLQYFARAEFEALLVWLSQRSQRRSIQTNSNPAYLQDMAQSSTLTPAIAH